MIEMPQRILINYYIDLSSYISIYSVKFVCSRLLLIRTRWRINWMENIIWPFFFAKSIGHTSAMTETTVA